MDVASFPDFATNAQKLAPLKYSFSFCTLVTDPAMYSGMVDSFVRAGFSTETCEFLYLDNSQSQGFDAYAGLNHMLSVASGAYVVLCHQDLLAIDGRQVLEERLAELDERDPNWGLAGNAGFTAERKGRVRITDRYGANQSIGPFPSRVVSLDENLMIVKNGTRFGCSHDLAGFHMYGPDLVTQAGVAGWNAYVIDFHVEHLGRGSTGRSFVDCQVAFEQKYRHAFRPRRFKTTITRTYLGTPSIWARHEARQSRKLHLSADAENDM